MPKGIKTVFFDLDGTIIDSEPLAARVVDECFAEWRIRIETADARFVAGRTWARALEYLFGRYELPLGRDQATRRIQDRYRQALEQELPVVPGSVDAVAALSANYQLGLVSGSNRDDILWVLEKLKITNHFEVILGAEDYRRSKPAPDGYLRGLELLRAQPGASIVFEDSEAGIASARAAGMKVVVVSSTNHFEQDTTLGNHHIKDLSGVTVTWLEQLEC